MGEETVCGPQIGQRSFFLSFHLFFFFVKGCARTSLEEKLLFKECLEQPVIV